MIVGAVPAEGHGRFRRRAATPAGMVVAAAEFPVGRVMARPHQHVAKGAGIAKEAALFGACVKE